MRKAALVFLSLTIVIFCFPKVVLATISPNLESPSSGSITDKESPTLVWNWSGACVSSGSCYLVQIDDQPDFLSPYRDHYTTTTSYSPQLTNGSWYWRVKAKDTDNIWSPWSEIWNFTIDKNSSPPISTQTGNPVLNEFMPNPASGDEWAEIFNNSTEEAVLTGWKVDDSEGGSAPTPFPDGTKVAPKSFFVLYFANKLNNTSDTIRLLKPDGSVAETYSYSSTEKGKSFTKDSHGSWFLTASISPNSENPNPPKPTMNQPVKTTTKALTTSKPTAPPVATAEASLTKLPNVLSAKDKNISTVASDFNNKKSNTTIFLPLIILGSLLIAGSGVFLVKRKKRSGQSENSDQPL